MQSKLINKILELNELLSENTLSAYEKRWRNLPLWIWILPWASWHGLNKPKLVWFVRGFRKNNYFKTLNIICSGVFGRNIKKHYLMKLLTKMFGSNCLGVVRECLGWYKCSPTTILCMRRTLCHWIKNTWPPYGRHYFWQWKYHWTVRATTPNRKFFPVREVSAFPFG